MKHALKFLKRQKLYSNVQNKSHLSLSYLIEPPTKYEYLKYYNILTLQL